MDTPSTQHGSQAPEEQPKPGAETPHALHGGVFPYHHLIAHSINVLLVLSVLILAVLYVRALPSDPVVTGDRPVPTTPINEGVPPSNDVPFLPPPLITPTDPVIVPAEDMTITPEPARCIVTGCSGQICSDQDMASTCEYREEYACYQLSRCERQADGACGWTQTPELTSCLINPPSLLE